MLSSLVTALRTLTIIPVPGVDASNRSSSLSWFPLIGLLIGGLTYALASGCGYLWNSYPFISAVLIVICGIVLTGALHIDGLADAADGFGGGTTKEQILRIFKDSRHGTFGVVAIAGDVLARCVLIVWCIGENRIGLLLIAPFFSRTAMAWVCSLVPYARDTGGMAESFTKTRPPILLWVTTLVPLILIGIAYDILPLAVSLGFAATAVLLFVTFCVRKINGITGDCLGSVNEIGEIGILLGGCLYFSCCRAFAM